MPAVQSEQFGAPSALQIHDVPQPRPNSGEVLVEIRAASINPSDAKNVQGAMKQTTLPRIPGRDFVGVGILAATTFSKLMEIAIALPQRSVINCHLIPKHFSSSDTTKPQKSQLPNALGCRREARIDRD